MRRINESIAGVLPQPRHVTPIPGRCDLRAGVVARNETSDQRVASALDRLTARLRTPCPTTETERRPCPTTVRSDPAGLPHTDAYRLTISPDAITIIGGSPAGCFYAIQTLTQLVARCETPGLLPCGTVEDQPDFDTRGLLHDITRGKVPTLATLKMLVDRLAILKVNQLQLNIEHAFVFSFDPDICSEDEGITPAEVEALDDYCRDRFVQLVPAVATFGHMGRILSMPRYRALAERESPAPWAALDWTQRTRGFTLDCANPDAQRLVEHIWSDILDVFRAPTVNICGDEPHDLGQGKNLERYRGRLGEVYLSQIRRVQDICARRDRRVQFWSDVVVNYPDLFHLIDEGATVLHWGYEDEADYGATARFIDAGLATVVCPGTSGWKRVLNAMNLAERNIATFARSGKTCGAMGLLNTDWGDHGHFNLLSGSWHGIALGASKAWRADHVTGREFDALLARHLFGLENADLISSLRRASVAGETYRTWAQLYMPQRALGPYKALPSIEETDQTISAARETVAMIDAVKPRDALVRQDLDEWRIACEFQTLWAQKMRLIRTSGSPPPSPPDIRRWCDGVGDASARYEGVWLNRNKRGGLSDVTGALKRAVDDISEHPG